jgi:hypothetical protein
MEHQNLPNQGASQDDSQGDSLEKVHRREVAVRMGKFFAYTAPALIALATAKDACAN